MAATPLKYPYCITPNRLQRADVARDETKNRLVDANRSRLYGFAHSTREDARDESAKRTPYCACDPCLKCCLLTGAEAILFVWRRRGCTRGLLGWWSQRRVSPTTPNWKAYHIIAYSTILRYGNINIPFTVCCPPALNACQDLD